MFFLKIFWRERDWNAVIEAEAEAIVRKRIAARIRLYAENPALLRAACAGYYGVRPEHLPDTVRSQAMIARAVRAFGDELALIDPQDHWPATPFIDFGVGASEIEAAA